MAKKRTAYEQHVDDLKAKRASSYQLDDVIELIIIHSDHLNEMGEPSITSFKARLGHYFWELVEENQLAGVPERFTEALSELQHNWDRRGPEPLNNVLIDALWLEGYVGIIWTPSPSFTSYNLNPKFRTELEASEKFTGLTDEEREWLRRVGHDLGKLVKH